ncbi:peptidoglycan DD-metalloendopeptidase family protein [Variovorax dokdonensis]|uniref:Peptidoglycan DD-metalloendopeptidase family protein n=1 Tax=Variovorax dokdonensis TaxID=344883 RepID=A0ABT7N7Q3_9BURK|nr:peptidoglycan DD-metalloendopeptidase family protein [Variovorax dokdonensis]MDM0043973.1 peptidoglycan DD-metalloendopeptidase family protein [Variovorax dokdonensis]
MHQDKKLHSASRPCHIAARKVAFRRVAMAAGAAASAILITACTSTPLPPMAPYPAPGTPGAPAGTPQSGMPGAMQPGVSGQPVQPGAVPGTAVAPLTARFIRPANGTVVGRFDGKDNKGIDIAGQLGDPVMASAAGRVVYVGDELRNFGNLIIVDHGDNFLTAYAHNRIVLVQERQTVTQGQKIGEIGRNAEGTPMLHFEIRKNGIPVDPAPYLAGMQP